MIVSTCSQTGFPPIAQLVEQIPLKDKVAGSIPAGWTRKVVLVLKIYARVV